MRLHGAMSVVLVILAALLAGCASLPIHATQESMRDREACLNEGRVWIETREQYACRGGERRL